MVEPLDGVGDWGVGPWDWGLVGSLGRRRENNLRSHVARLCFLGLGWVFLVRVIFGGKKGTHGLVLACG